MMNLDEYAATHSSLTATLRKRLSNDELHVEDENIPHIIALRSVSANVHSPLRDMHSQEDAHTSVRGRYNPSCKLYTRSGQVEQSLEVPYSQLAVDILHEN